jgi:hypothetical protein
MDDESDTSMRKPGRIGRIILATLGALVLVWLVSWRAGCFEVKINDPIHDPYDEDVDRAEKPENDGPRTD